MKLLSQKIFFILTLVTVGACSSLYEDFDKGLLENKEYDKKVSIKEVKSPVSWGSPITATAPVAVEKALVKEKKAAEKASAIAGSKAPAKNLKHEPDIEDPGNFNGRQPIINPFREGEEVTYTVSYGGVLSAGQFVMATQPAVQLNGRKAYRFTYKAKSSSVFAVFYAVDDSAEAYMDYENLTGLNYTIKARESKQVRDVRTYFDWSKMKAFMWDKKIKKGKGPEEKNIEWDILPYSQNVFTVPYYLRCFDLKVGKEYSVRVAHEGKNIIMRAKVVRKETLSTDVGKLETLVLKPEFEIGGVFKPVGDVFIWVTNDERKLIARIESKIKIGSIVVSLDQIK